MGIFKPGGGGGGTDTPTRVIKAANQSRNTTTTYADDDTLLFSVAANKVYAVRIHVEYTLGLGGAKFQLAGPASTTVKSFTHLKQAGTMSNGNNPEGTLSQVIVSDANTSGTNAFLVECIVRTTNAGTVSLQWAQSTSNGANSTVLAGSHIEYVTLI